MNPSASPANPSPAAEGLRLVEAVDRETPGVRRPGPVAAPPAGPVRPLRPPRLAWPSVLSLDAPAVAVLWQAIFSVAHGHGWPRWDHAAALGLAVWLIYATDRLLDVRRLDTTRPHLLRHRFHADHRRAFGAAAVLVLGLSTTLVLLGLEASLAACGMGVLAVVVLYATGVHARVDPCRGLPKEIRVGLIFAAGVSLTSWWRAPGPPLLVGTALAGLLFSANCLIVTLREREVEPARDRGSADGRAFERRRIRIVLGVASGGSVVGSAAGVVPLPLAAALLAGVTALALLARPVELQRLGPGGWTRFDRRGVLVDAALLAPPALALWLATVVQAATRDGVGAAVAGAAP